MLRTKRWPIAGVASLGLLAALSHVLLAPATARATTFTLVAETGTGSAYTSLTPAPAFSLPDSRMFPVINDAGEVAFWAQSATGQEIVRGNGSALVTIHQLTAGGSTSYRFAGLAMNSAGRVAFATTTGFTSSTLLVGDGTGPASVRASGGANAFSDLSIAADGTVVESTYDDTLNYTLLRAWQPGATTATVLADTSTNVYGSFAFTDISADGRYVAFGVPYVGSSNATVGRIDRATGLTTTVATSAEIPNAVSVSMNDLGTVAVVSSTQPYWSSTPGQTALYTRAVGGPLTLFATAATLGVTSIDAVSIDNAGNLLYLTDAGTASAAIYDATLGRLIGVGDSLFGSVVSDIAMHEAFALNNNGQFAFWAKLSDGREVVALADTGRGAAAPGPTVPEPRSSSLLEVLGTVIALRFVSTYGERPRTAARAS
ncbi:MAG: hypothetical protein D6776_10270 [Planctomycetota bacterium]|nr:MAG: hypothetical protein D6776_10270 [Planctomycetota bacterium]